MQVTNDVVVDQDASSQQRRIAHDWRATPRACALRAEREPLPRGEWERFTGYGVVALPFGGGDLLAFRRFGASSVGPAYAAIWHRDAGGVWTFFVDVAPALACPRYFGVALDRVVLTEIRTTWVGHDHLVVSAPAARVEWGMRMRATHATRALGLLAGLAPRRAWRSDRVLRAAGVIGGVSLGAGPLRLSGQTPNGQFFRLRPRRLWHIDAAAAQVEGRELGPIGGRQGGQLGDLRLPAVGIFACGGGEFEAFEPSLHRDRVARRVERS